MSILVDASTRVICQGITGEAGSFHTKGCLEYGTRVVAGVTPGRGGQLVHGVPVFDTVREAVRATQATATMVFVPAPCARDAIMEAAASGLGLVVAITEGIPTHDMLRVRAALRGSPVRVIGPNCPGLITPGATKLGIMPGYIHRPGRVGVVSRSGTLTYEIVYGLTQRGIGQSTCLGVGGDPVIGTSFVEVLALFEADPETDAVVLIGEIGGTQEEEAAAFIQHRMRKPVVALIAGRGAPTGRRMGHAGAMVTGGRGTAEAKVAALEAAGVAVAESPADVAALVAARLHQPPHVRAGNRAHGSSA